MSSPFRNVVRSPQRQLNPRRGGRPGRSRYRSSPTNMQRREVRELEHQRHQTVEDVQQTVPIADQLKPHFVLTSLVMHSRVATPKRRTKELFVSNLTSANTRKSLEMFINSVAWKEGGLIANVDFHGCRKSVLVGARTRTMLASLAHANTGETEKGTRHFEANDGATRCKQIPENILATSSHVSVMMAASKLTSLEGSQGTHTAGCGAGNVFQLNGHRVGGNRSMVPANSRYAFDNPPGQNTAQTPWNFSKPCSRHERHSVPSCKSVATHRPSQASHRPPVASTFQV